MLACANNQGIYGICIETTNELKQLNDENWGGITYMGYFNEFIYLLHNSNFYAFNLESIQYTKVLEGLTYDDYARFVIKNGIVFFFAEYTTKIRTYDLKSRERTEIDISIDS